MNALVRDFFRNTRGAGGGLETKWKCISVVGTRFTFGVVGVTGSSIADSQTESTLEAMRGAQLLDFCHLVRVCHEVFARDFLVLRLIHTGENVFLQCSISVVLTRVLCE